MHFMVAFLDCKNNICSLMETWLINIYEVWFKNEGKIKYLVNSSYRWELNLTLSFLSAKAKGNTLPFLPCVSFNHYIYFLFIVSCLNSSLAQGV